MPLKPWYKVVTPREDLREGKPLDASEFAVHLDKVREGTAPKDYADAERFFERTFLTQNLKGLAAETVRRLSGEKTETSAVFNLATQFGGGKTHALTLLYHLAKQGPDSIHWKGVRSVLDKAGVPSVPAAAVAVFVGTEFDSIAGRGGQDGTPLRRTPWGEMAFQLGGAEAFGLVAEHENKLTAPAGDVIRQILPRDRPCLLLMDELMNYVSRTRKSGLATQLYDFLHNLSETVRGLDRAVLAVSIPASELEMTAEDSGDYNRFKKMLDRLGKPVILAAEGEISEIIRRRLFEWGGLPDEGKKTAAEYADWILEHRQQVPNWFSADNAREAFAAAYPFHPTVLSVFERKWQTLPRFQQTRGILRLLALWVSKAYQDGYKGAHRDALIGLGTAPLDESMFRAALFEQLGESKLEAAVTTDICGKKDANAVRLDKESVDAIKKGRLHQKAATAIFFESNGGQTKTVATIPEIRLAVGEPDLDIGHLDTVLEAMASSCYYLTVDRNRYRFSLTPNLNKLLADRRASIPGPKISERVHEEIVKVFAAGQGVERFYFKEKSGEIPDRPVLILVVLSPDHSMEEKDTKKLAETMIRESGTSSRTFKNALVLCVAESAGAMFDEARTLLAWEDIDEEEGERLDDTQKRHLAENLKKSQRDLREGIWRAYKNLLILDKNNTLKTVDLGPVHSSAAENMLALILNRMRQDGDLEKGVSPNFLLRNWPPAFKEWSTKAVRDAFYASPIFPKLLNPEAVKETVARGVEGGLLAYVGMAGEGRYEPFHFKCELAPEDVEISEDMFIVTRETAEAHVMGAPRPSPVPSLEPQPGETPKPSPSPVPPAPTPAARLTNIAWSGEVPHQKWMNFYTKVLSRFSAKPGVSMKLNLTVSLEGDLPQASLADIQTSLKELGLDDQIEKTFDERGFLKGINTEFEREEDRI